MGRAREGITREETIEMNIETRKNVYTCQSCGKYLITVDIDAGVTPFSIRCACGGDMYSAFYSLDGSGFENEEPTHGWLRLTEKEIIEKPEYAQEYYRKGGMELV